MTEGGCVPLLQVSDVCMATPGFHPGALGANHTTCQVGHTYGVCPGVSGKAIGWFGSMGADQVLSLGMSSALPRPFARGLSGRLGRRPLPVKPGAPCLVHFGRARLWGVSCSSTAGPPTPVECCSSSVSIEAIVGASFIAAAVSVQQHMLQIIQQAYCSVEVGGGDGLSGDDGHDSEIEVLAGCSLASDVIDAGCPDDFSRRL